MPVCPVLLYRMALVSFRRRLFARTPMQASQPYFTSVTRYYTY